MLCCELLSSLHVLGGCSEEARTKKHGLKIVVVYVRIIILILMVVVFWFFGGGGTLSYCLHL